MSDSERNISHSMSSDLDETAYSECIKICGEIKKICKPLLQHTPVKCFEYSRVHDNGKTSVATNDAGHLKEALRFFRESRIPFAQEHRESNGYFLVSSWKDDLRDVCKRSLLERLYCHDSTFDVHNELSVIKRHPNYTDYYNFYAGNRVPDMTNFYVNNLELFERFILYFVNTAHPILLKVNSNPIVNSSSKSFAYKFDNETDPTKINKDAFIKQLSPKRFFILVDGREVYLTKREMECASFLLHGRSNRTIAEALFISHRTVESHLESLRIKTNCADRSELISFLVGCGLANFIS